MAKTYDLLVRARGETKDAERAMRQLQRQVDGFGRGLRQAGTALTIGVTAPVLAMSRVGIQELNDMQKTNAQTFAALKSTGKAAGVSASEIQKLAQNLSKLSGIDDQVIQGGENILLTFTKIGKQDRIFARATAAALDLSVAFGKDMNSSAIMVGKALNDPIKGITALNKAGVSFTAAQKKTIERLVETNQVAKAQKLILKELETQVGGSAKAYGDTAAGAVGKLKEQFAGISAELVSNFLPAFTRIGNMLQRGMDWFSGLSDSTKSMVGTALLLGAALGPVLFVMGSLVSAVSAFLPLIVGISLPMAGAAAAAIAVGAALVILYRRSETARLMIHGLWEILKKSPLGTVVRAVDGIAQQFGGWKDVFRYAGIAALGFAKIVLSMALSVTRAINDLTGNWLQKFASILKAVAFVRPEFKAAANAVGDMADRSKRGSSEMEKAMTRDIKKIDAQIKSLKRAIDAVPSMKKIEISITQRVSAAGGGALPTGPTFGGSGGGGGGGGGAGRSVVSKAAQVAWAGINIVTGAVRPGANVSATSVGNFAALSAGQPYTVTSDKDGRQSVTTNEAVKKFVEARKRQAEQRLAQVIRQRGTMMKTRPGKVKRRNALQAAAKKRKLTAAEKKELANVLKWLENYPGAMEALEAEIVSLGGQIQSDAEALQEPEVDNSGVDSAAADAAAQAARDAENFERRALGRMSVEEEIELAAANEIRARHGLPPVRSMSEIGSNPTSVPPVVSDTSAGAWNPLMPSSYSASGAVASAANRAITGSGVTINVTPNSADPEAIANRVAWVLGGTMLRMGGGI